MLTYFDTISRSFDQVEIKSGIQTLQFLEATEGLIKMFDLLGSSAFAIVQNDMNGNVAKIRARFLATPDKSDTLQSLILNEQGEKKKVATEGMMWLFRGLAFTHIALSRSLANKSEEMTESFTKSYEVTLKKHHSFVVKPLFTLAMKACPYRKDFYAKLGSPLEKVELELDSWLTALLTIINTIQPLVEASG